MTEINKEKKKERISIDTVKENKILYPCGQIFFFTYASH